MLGRYARCCEVALHVFAAVSLKLTMSLMTDQTGWGIRLADKCSFQMDDRWRAIDAEMTGREPFNLERRRSSNGRDSDRSHRSSRRAPEGPVTLHQPEESRGDLGNRQSPWILWTPCFDLRQ